jgi:hypothetical protein
MPAALAPSIQLDPHAAIIHSAVNVAKPDTVRVLIANPLERAIPWSRDACVEIKVPVTQDGNPQAIASIEMARLIGVKVLTQGAALWTVSQQMSAESLIFRLSPAQSSTALLGVGVNSFLALSLTNIRSDLRATDLPIPVRVSVLGFSPLADATQVLALFRDAAPA